MRGDIERFNLGVRYTPAPGSALNASYRYTRQLVDPTAGIETIKQIDLSGQWPVDAQLDAARALELLAARTARRWRRSRASSTMATAGCCASSASG